ncbi:MAG: adenine phosphoribosyltransferase [Elusimicrobiota bacterium]
MEDIKKAVRDVPDFPKKGIIFKDITTVLKDAALFKKLIDVFVEKYKNKDIKYVIGIEARGFIIGSALAYKLGAGFVPVRKKGKLPAETIQAEYELEYGTDIIEMHKDALKEGDNVLVIDDLLATGGTLNAACSLVDKLKGNIVAVACVIELSFLNGREKLKGRNIFSLIQY